MPSTERAFTLQLMQENEQLQANLNILVALAQVQHALAEAEGHPFPTMQLEGNLAPDQVQQMVVTLHERLRSRQPLQIEGEAVADAKPGLSVVEGVKHGSNGAALVRPWTEV